MKILTTIRMSLKIDRKQPMIIQKCFSKLKFYYSKSVFMQKAFQRQWVKSWARACDHWSLVQILSQHRSISNLRVAHDSNNWHCVGSSRNEFPLFVPRSCAWRTVALWLVNAGVRLSTEHVRVRVRVRLVVPASVSEWVSVELRASATRDVCLERNSFPSRMERFSRISG